jgi:hypothetical protein
VDATVRHRLRHFELAVATVLAAYMGGSPSARARRAIPAAHHAPGLTYALLELGIARARSSRCRLLWVGESSPCSAVRRAAAAATSDRAATTLFYLISAFVALACHHADGRTCRVWRATPSRGAQIGAASACCMR